MRTALRNKRLGYVLAAALLLVLITYGFMHRGRVLEFLYMWSWHFGIAAMLAAPILFFGRRRAAWQSWELLAFVLPFMIWLALALLVRGRPKTMANLVEPFFISFAIPVAAGIRVALGKRFDGGRYFRLIVLLALCAFAVAVYFLTPELPEEPAA